MFPPIITIYQIVQKYERYTQSRSVHNTTFAVVSAGYYWPASARRRPRFAFQITLNSANNSVEDFSELLFPVCMRKFILL